MDDSFWNRKKPFDSSFDSNFESNFDSNFDSNFNHNNEDTHFQQMRALFFLFFGTVLFIIVCALILIIVNICCRLIKGEPIRGFGYQHPYRNNNATRIPASCKY